MKPGGLGGFDRLLNNGILVEKHQQNSEKFARGAEHMIRKNSPKIVMSDGEASTNQARVLFVRTSPFNYIDSLWSK